MVEARGPEGPSTLVAQDVAVSFGGIKALKGVSLDVPKGQICGLIGPNGAGKTTFFNVVTRLNRLSGGRIEIEGADISALRSRDMMAKGVARTFQNLGLYPEMTVLENVMLGAHCHAVSGLGAALGRPFAIRRAETGLAERCMAILDELGMADVAERPGGSLPYPLQKRMEIARALACRPKLLLLDEPAGGLTHGEVDAFGETVAAIRDRHGLSVLLIEHHMGLVMSICDRVHVFHLGESLASGTPAEIRSDRRVVDAYLGRSA